MTRTSALVIVISAVALASTAAGKTIGYWCFEGPPGESADGKKVVSEVFPAAMNGTGQKSKGTEAKLEYQADVPAPFTYDPVARRFRPDKTALRFAAFEEKTDTGNLFDYADTVTVPDSPLSRPAAFTLEGFIKTAGDNRKWMPIVGKERSWGPVWGLDTEDWHPGGLLKMRMKLQVKGSNIIQYRTKDSPDLKKEGWHHFAYTYDPKTGEMKLYWDYRLAASHTIEAADKRELNYDKPQPDKLYPLLIGGSEDNKKGWNGWLDELRLSDQVLAPEDFLRPAAKAAFPVAAFDPDALAPSKFGAGGEAKPAAAATAGATTKPAEEGQPVGWWRFEAKSGTFADGETVASEMNPKEMSGKGVRSTGGQGELFYIAQVPGPEVYDPITKRLYRNTTSMKFASYATKGEDGKEQSHSDYVVVPDGALSRPQSLTLEGFLKCEKVPPKWTPVIGKRREFAFVWGLDTEVLEPGYRMKLRIQLTTSGKLQQFRGDASPTLKADDEWHHFALTYDSTAGEAKLYWDHKLAVTYTVPEGRKKALGYSKGEKYTLVIGGQPDKRGWDGWIDEVRLTSGVLSPEQFLRLKQ